MDTSSSCILCQPHGFNVRSVCRPSACFCNSSAAPASMRGVAGARFLELRLRAASAAAALALRGSGGRRIKLELALPLAAASAAGGAAGHPPAALLGRAAVVRSCGRSQAGEDSASAAALLLLQGWVAGLAPALSNARLQITCKPPSPSSCSPSSLLAPLGLALQ